VGSTALLRRIVHHLSHPGHELHAMLVRAIKQQLNDVVACLLQMEDACFSEYIVTVLQVNVVPEKLLNPGGTVPWESAKTQWTRRSIFALACSSTIPSSIALTDSACGSFPR